ncbi:MAG: hypothetical protein HY698_12530 [Deltaproteobacteria bacterium]|nr:hypothetical protein [Deltaproteobacteria bacterium]
MKRVLLSGLGAVLSAVAVAYVIAPVFGVPRVDFIGWLAVSVAGVDPSQPRLVGVSGWFLSLLAGEAFALGFALVWDMLPPRTRPVSKSLVFCSILFLLLRPPPEAIPTALAFAVVLGVAYRPHPAPPEEVGKAKPLVGRSR